jgi:hypothetical protein
LAVSLALVVVLPGIPHQAWEASGDFPVSAVSLALVVVVLLGVRHRI